MQKTGLQKALGIGLITGIFGITQWSVLAKIQLTQGIRIDEARLEDNSRLKGHHSRALKRSEWAKQVYASAARPHTTAVAAPSAERKLQKAIVLPDLEGDEQNQVWKVLQFIQKSVEHENQETYSSLMRGLEKLKKQNKPLFDEYCQQLVEHLRIFKRVNGRPDEYFTSSDSITREFINQHLPEWSVRIAEMEFIAKTESL